MDHTKPVAVDLDATKAAFAVPAPALGQALQPVGAAALPRHPALDGPPDAFTMLAAFRRRWVVALVLAVAAAVIVGPATWYLVPPSSYTARASLRVATNPRRIMFEPHDGSGNALVYQRTMVALLRDQTIIAHALTSPKLQGLPTFSQLALQDMDAEEWLAKNLSAGFREGSEVLEIALSGDHPDDLAAIVNAVVDSYMTLVVKEERDARLARLEKLKELRSRYQNELKVKRSSLKQIAENVGSGDQASLAVAQQFRSMQLSVAQSELMRTHTEIRKAQSELTALENKKDDPTRVEPQREPSRAVPGPEPDLDAAVERHPDVVAAKRALDEAQAKYAAQDRRIRDKADPYLMRWRQYQHDSQTYLVQMRRRVRAELAEAAQRPAVGGPKALNTPTAIEERHREVTRVRAQLEVLEGYQKNLRAETERLQREVQDASKNGLDLENERNEIEIAAEFANKVGHEVEAVEVELDAPERVAVLSQAKAPKRKDDSKRVKTTAGAALGSFAFCILAISFWEFRARRVESQDEVVRILGMKLVGTLPDPSRRPRQLPAPARPDVPAPPDAPASPPQRVWQDPLVESVNATRTMLLHASQVEHVRAVMVTSAVKGEGKTSLACHLATSLARTGRRILLVDGDLRSPSVHRLFQLPLVDGLCELVRGETNVAEVVQKTTVPNLSVIAAGRCDAAAVHALSRDHSGSLITRFKSEYDFVIVDSAPLLPLADSLLLAQSVDGVLFSVLRHHSRLPQVHAARERLAVLGVKVLGAVVNGVRGDYQYGYYPADEPQASA